MFLTRGMLRWSSSGSLTEVRLFSLTVNRPVWDIQGRGDCLLSKSKAGKWTFRRCSAEQRAGKVLASVERLSMENGNQILLAFVEKRDAGGDGGGIETERGAGLGAGVGETNGDGNG